jgi:hypothetical protein
MAELSMAETLEKLKKIKKKPSDWRFVPNRSKYQSVPVVLFAGDTRMGTDKDGKIRNITDRKHISILVKSCTKNASGVLMGGYVPQQEGDHSAADVLEALLEMSLNPSCPIVPYEKRDVPTQLKSAEMEFATERAAHEATAQKLRDLEAKSVKDLDRLAELEKFMEDQTKPGKK